MGCTVVARSPLVRRVLRHYALERDAVDGSFFKRGYGDVPLEALNIVDESLSRRVSCVFGKQRTEKC